MKSMLMTAVLSTFAATAISAIATPAMSAPQKVSYTCDNSHIGRPATVAVKFDTQIYTENSVVVMPKSAVFFDLESPKSPVHALTVNPGNGAPETAMSVSKMKVAIGSSDYPGLLGVMKTDGKVVVYLNVFDANYILSCK
jgi:hypothetical protein